jgi:hypothetical protein
LVSASAAVVIQYENPHYVKSDYFWVMGYFHFETAMAAGVTDRLWSVEDLVALWEAYEQRRAERAA